MHTNLLYTLCLAIAVSHACPAAGEQELPAREGAGAIPVEDMDKLLEAGALTPAKTLQQIIEEQQAVMDHYHENPTLEKAAEILGFSLPHASMVTYRMGYYSQLYRQHAAQREKLIAYTENGFLSRSTHCAAEWLSGDPACSEDAFLQLEYDPIMKGTLRIGKNTPRPDFTRLQDLEAGIEETQLLDMAWGAYDATHDKAILLSFIHCAARTAPPEKDAVRFWMNQADDQRRPLPPQLEGTDIVAMAAKWSINSRAKQNAAFAATVEACLSELSDDEQKRFRAPLPDHPNNDQTYSPNPN